MCLLSCPARRRSPGPIARSATGDGTVLPFCRNAILWVPSTPYRVCSAGTQGKEAVRPCERGMMRVLEKPEAVTGGGRHHDFGATPGGVPRGVTERVCCCGSTGRGSAGSSRYASDEGGTPFQPAGRAAESRPERQSRRRQHGASSRHEHPNPRQPTADAVARAFASASARAFAPDPVGYRRKLTIRTVRCGEQLP